MFDAYFVKGNKKYQHVQIDTNTSRLLSNKFYEKTLFKCKSNFDYK